MWTTTDLALLGGADDGDRTRILSLGTRSVCITRAVTCDFAVLHVTTVDRLVPRRIARASHDPPPSHRSLVPATLLGAAVGSGVPEASRSDGAVWGRGPRAVAPLTWPARRG